MSTDKSPHFLSPSRLQLSLLSFTYEVLQYVDLGWIKILYKIRSLRFVAFHLSISDFVFRLSNSIIRSVYSINVNYLLTLPRNKSAGLKKDNHQSALKPTNCEYIFYHLSLMTQPKPRSNTDRTV